MQSSNVVGTTAVRSLGGERDTFAATAGRRMEAAIMTCSFSAAASRTGRTLSPHATNSLRADLLADKFGESGYCQRDLAAAHVNRIQVSALAPIS